MHDAATFPASARRNSTQQSLFSSHPAPLLGVRYCLAIRKSNVELSPISRGSFLLSSIPCDVEPAPSHRGAKHRRLFVRWWLCFPTRCKAPGGCFPDHSHHRDPSQVLSGEPTWPRAMTLRPWDCLEDDGCPLSPHPSN